MRAKSDVRSVRRSLILHEGAVRRLNSLREATEADSDSEIVRKALMYYEQLCEDDANGRELFVRDAHNNDVVVPVATVDEHAQDEGAPVKRNLVLHEKSAARLDALCKRRNESASGLVRDALVVYQKLVDNTLCGNKLIVRDGRGQEMQYFIPVSRPVIPRRKKPAILERLMLA